MNTNTPALATVYDTLQTALAQLQAIDADKIEIGQPRADRQSRSGHRRLSGGY